MSGDPRRGRKQLARRLAITLGLALLGLVLMLVAAATLGPSRLAAGDAHYVLAAARSLAYDGDLDLTNQYLVMGERWGLSRDVTSDGWRLPPRELGASVLMVPGLLLHHLLGLAPRWEPACACIAASLCLGPCWLACVRIGDELELAPGHAEAVAAAAVLGFVVPYYAVGQPGYSHAPDALISAWLAWALVARRPAPLVGMLLACAVLTRLQNLLWLAWPLAEAVMYARAHARERGRIWARIWARPVTIAGLALLGLAPQLYLGLAHPGSARTALGWTPAFFDLDAYGSDLVRVMLGPHGLLRWTPIAGLALVGLVLPTRRDQPGLGPRVVFVAMWLLLATVRDVDGGDAFGARRMAGLVGLLTLGLSVAWSRLGEAQTDVRQLARPLALAAALMVTVNLVRTHRAVTGELSLVAPDRSPGHR